MERDKREGRKPIRSSLGSLTAGHFRIGTISRCQESNKMALIEFHEIRWIHNHFFPNDPKHHCLSLGSTRLTLCPASTGGKEGFLLSQSLLEAF